MAYLALGGNAGDREAMLAAAAARLDAHSAIQVCRWSSLYETEPVGPEGQPWYLNAVLEVHTPLSPVELLGTCKQIEKDLGRKPGPRWGPRPIDIDILLYNHLELATAELVIPHPELARRAFVLVPLAEVAPELEVPGTGAVRSILARLGDSHQVRLHQGKAWVEGVPSGRK